VKALFVTHDVSLYGASRSLQLLLRNYSELDFDLVVDRTLLRKHGLRQITESFGVARERVRPFFLPFDLCTAGKGNPSLLRPLRRWLWNMDSKRFYHFLCNKPYDFIHLNSLVLHPVITREHPFVIHVRERYDGSCTTAHADLRNARGVVFIDESTYEPFRHTTLQSHTIINNPFHMVPPKNDHLRERWQNLCPNRTVFALIGHLTKEKGTDFVIQTFRSFASEEAMLLIVGNGLTPFVEYCKGMAGEDGRIRFLGEESEIERIYAVADYVIRGEDYPCVGRTVYEALYSGCHVILPGSTADREVFFDYDRFQEKMHFYAPRDQRSLTRLFESLVHSRVTDRHYTSNIDEFVARFREFIAGLPQADSRVRNKSRLTFEDVL
jgi:glycosyltransferase involved in cell wall biosynthesis